MQKRVYVLFLGLLLFAFGATAQTNAGSLKGTCLNKDTQQPVPFAQVLVSLNGTVVNGGSADINGSYTIKPLDPGTYDVSFQAVGFATMNIGGVVVKSGKITDLNAEMTASSMDMIIFEEYKVPLIDKDGGSSGGTVTREDLKNMPSRSVGGIATTVAGATDTGDGISIRGAREGSTWIYIDGIKVRGSSALPKSAVEEIAVITGGIPANIGDATGGVINVSLRNASANYTGGVEVISSGFKSGNSAIGLDKFGYNLIEGSLSGPLLTKTDAKGNKKSLLGFFVSANYTDILDNDPQFGGMMRMKQSTRDRLLLDPLRPNIDDTGQATGVLYNSDFLTSDDFESTPTRLNVRNRSANLVAKIDVTTSETMTLTIGGTAAYSSGNDFSRANSLMNWENNQKSAYLDWRAYAKFSQRFKNDEGEEGKGGGLRNVFYSVMIDYSRNTYRQQDQSHGSDLFKYGHVGYFDIIQGNTYQQEPGSFFRQTGFQDINIFFTPSTYNPDLAAITSQYFAGAQEFPTYQLALQQIYDANGNLIRDRNQIFLDDPGTIFAIGTSPASTLNNITAANALRNGDEAPGTYNLWSYLGTQSNNYSIGNANQFRISGMGSADIKDHAIQVGFEFEQRLDAGYSVAPVGLWRLARLTANSHLEKVDNQGIGYDSTMVYRDGYYYVYYNTAVGESNQAEFDYNLREALGLNPRGGDYLNVDNLDPNFMSIDMFNADELINNGNPYISYYGYDPSGNPLTGRKPTIEQFFSETYKVGDITYYSRPIGAFQPIYTSGYIMDKFAFKDLIFNLGVRVDRYDANQPVLKDPFVVSEAFTAGEISALGSSEIPVAHPSNIGDDFVVYVDDVNNPTSISGYRDGDNWYNASGQLVSDPSVIGGSSNPKPYLKVNKDAPLTSGAFKDYTPAVNIMPRIAFSFPISEQAIFFAHYDVLTQRPTAYSRFDPTDYLNMRFQNNPLINNPALKPERTVDYALGFQQVLSPKSSLKIEAFYRELRNMIQMRKFNGAYPIAYRAFDNIDFGTVKGLTLTYDLRRSGNIRLNASYTLQFADGTGSTTQSQAALINAGLPNLRSINPFNYDQRHRFILTTDYRFADGKEYNGPTIKDFQVLANTGFNFIANLGSGTPYTPQQFATPITGEITPSTEGSINGARLPWQFTVDFQADRNFALSFGGEGDKKKTANLNVYLWVTNLLNTRNVRSVHRFTGVAEDDGYLASSQAQQFINQQNDPEAFRMYYAMFVNDPNRLGAPRQIRLGLRLDF